MSLVKCELGQILIAEQREAQVIVLRELEGERILPIEIGIIEAIAINREVQGLEMLRPMTHDLLISAVMSLGAKIKHIVVNDIVTLQDGSGTYFAILVLEKDGQEISSIDCRPSDAIALAVRCGCPVYVSENILHDVDE